ncbi:hypothetical protein C7S16_3245 [Burkholderia thailandensis]|uniref:Uncharacterized protein n=1 Tax=Burkholderia thailandensis TaxID=57975 RepID=A0AAW9CU81_BURTH|nr:hypothetical protein [Burkholderia thailandensis]MDW9254195.1 hypothetical protein [Burkholderia thailandensis]
MPADARPRAASAANVTRRARAVRAILAAGPCWSTVDASQADRESQT